MPSDEHGSVTRWIANSSSRLDPIRDRDDFKALVLWLESRSSSPK
jgi:hypothetical protein